MSNNKILFAISAAFLLMLNVFELTAGETDSTKTKAGPYSLIVYAGGGYSFYSGTAGVAQTVETKLSRGGVAGSLRVMWHPDHRLRLGIESGRIPFYSYTIQNGDISGKMTVSAVPLLLEWSMPVTNRINIFAGYGIYLLNSRLDYEGITNSSSNSLGYVLAVNYIHPLSSTVGIAGELKWMDANETSDEMLSVQVQVVWRFFEW